MKWWYAGVVIIGMVIGWLAVRSYTIKKAIPISSTKVQTMTDIGGKSAQTVEEVGLVQIFLV
jgi:hypothetical protein